MIASAAKSLNPSRELREARAAFDYTPTAQNQMRLALALLETGAAEEAARNYEACLKGPFAADPEIKFCASRALVESGRFSLAIGHLEKIRAKDANFRAEKISLLVAKAFAGAGRNEEAKAEFESAEHRFGSFNVLAEYALLAQVSGDTLTAQKLKLELDSVMKRWNKSTRELNMSMIRRLNAADEIIKRAS